MNSTTLDPEDIGKVFVGGLSTQTTKESLHDYFSQFGEVIDSVVMKNNETGRSRGFGFVTYKNPDSLYKVLQISGHELDGKRIDPKECTPRSLQKSKKQVGKCKLFLGGLPADITEDDIRHGMSRFGKVDQVIIMLDQETKKCRGFGFLSFELEESIEQACAERFVTINDKKIECKKAEPRIRNPNQPSGQQRIQNGSNQMSPYGMIGNVNPSNWAMSPNQAAYTMPGGFSGYQNFTPSPISLTSSPIPSYADLQQSPYTPTYSQNYGTAIGNYNYSPVPSNVFSQTHDGGTPPADPGKTYGSNEYSQNASSYRPAKVYDGLNAADAVYNQNASSGVQRYHPYKV